MGSWTALPVSGLNHRVSLNEQEDPSHRILLAAGWWHRRAAVDGAGERIMPKRGGSARIDY